LSQRIRTWVLACSVRKVDCVTTKGIFVESFETFCFNLAAAIKASSLTRVELAARLGVKPATVKSWCVGRRAPTVIRLLELCEVLEVDAEELFRSPNSPQERFECPVCSQSFRRLVGLRIHVALRARERDGHEHLAEEGTQCRPQMSVLRGGPSERMSSEGPAALAAAKPVRPPRPISYAACY
jgi:transcriptional regulator with XRE-family HTH domain